MVVHPLKSPDFATNYFGEHPVVCKQNINAQSNDSLCTLDAGACYVSFILVKHDCRILMDERKQRFGIFLFGLVLYTYFTDCLIYFSLSVWR